MSGPTARKGKNALTASQIISALPKLKTKELATIKAAIEQLQPKGAPSTDIQLLYEAILTCLDSKLPWTKFNGSSAHHDFLMHGPGAVLFITKTFKPFKVATRVTTISIMRFLIGLLIVDLRKRYVPPSVGSVCKNLNRLPMVFDDAFPNYRESGLVPMLMKQMEK